MARGGKDLKKDFTTDEILTFRNRKNSETYVDWCAKYGYDEESFRLVVWQFRKKLGPYSARSSSSRVDVRNGREPVRRIGHKGVNLASIMAKQVCRCPVCSKDLIAHGYHLDHIMPISKGGGNEAWNIQFLCQTCNLHKSDENPFDWSERLGVNLPDAFKEKMRGK